jgi:hypothetical protein
MKGALVFFTFLVSLVFFSVLLYLTLTGGIHVAASQAKVLSLGESIFFTLWIGGCLYSSGRLLGIWQRISEIADGLLLRFNEHLDRSGK